MPISILDVLSVARPFTLSAAPAPAGSASLPAAVAALWDATPAMAAAFPGGLWADLAPAATALPFAVYSETGLDSGSRDSAGAIFELGTIDFTCYAAGKEAARAAGEAVFAAFDDATLPVTGRLVLEFRRSASFSLVTPEKGPGSADVWRTTQTYLFRIQR
jgi:hypothetical protein